MPFRLSKQGCFAGLAGGPHARCACRLSRTACRGQASEAFLQRLVALCVASHYRNTPNDLLLMADAPAHRLFALLGPVDDTLNALPDILAVVQAPPAPI
jgi:tRNA(Met) C34 N-acetyltransferase TmcA